ncbi:MAG: DNA/RNA non-specific endonuclease, partial [Kofleriaceae bacterium]
MRRNQSRLHGLIVVALFATLSGCLAEGMAPDPDPDDGSAQVGDLTSAEGFESGTKTAYAVANVSLGTGTWTLDEALIGTSTSDPKTGTKSARIRNSGRVTMGFDRTTGAGTVTIHHATFGSDSNGTWGLFSSTNGGSTWTQAGTSRTTTGSTLATASFTLNVAGAIRFEIRKLDGGSNRINIDDVTVTDFGTGGGGGGGGGDGGGTGAALSRHTTLGIPSPASTTDVNNFLSV